MISDPDLDPKLSDLAKKFQILIDKKSEGNRLEI
jgi:hypothetical protein